MNATIQNAVDKLSKENETFREEMNQLTTHNTFWKNKVKSMREEIKKLHSQPVASMLPSPPPVHNHNQHMNLSHSMNASQRHSLHQYSKSDNELCDLQSNDLES